MARKDQKNKLAEVPVGANLSEPLDGKDIAEREAGEIPAAETPKEEPAKKPGLFGGKRGEEKTPAPAAVLPSGIGTGGEEILDDYSIEEEILDDYSIEEEILAAEKGEIEYERDAALRGIIELAKKHAEIAKKNNYGTIASSWQSLAAVAQQVQTNSQKPYWTKREKV